MKPDSLRDMWYVGTRLLKNSVLAVPGVSDIDEGRHARRTGKMFDPAYVAGILKIHVRHALEAGLRIEGLRCLEVGPGNSIGQAFVLCLLGAASAIAFDVRRYANERTGRGVYRELVQALLATPPIDIGMPGPLPVVGIRERAQRMLPADRSFPILGGDLRYELLSGPVLPLAAASVDFAYSCSVLEHVPDIATTYGELARVIKPGGVMSHIIDLRDHHSDAPFDFLRYGDWLWSAMTSRSAGFTNRRRGAEHLQALRDSGFEVISERRVRADAPPPRDRVAARFSCFDDEELRSLTLVISARRR